MRIIIEHRGRRYRAKDKRDTAIAWGDECKKCALAKACINGTCTGYIIAQICNIAAPYGFKEIRKNK